MHKYLALEVIGELTIMELNLKTSVNHLILKSQIGKILTLSNIELVIIKYVLIIYYARIIFLKNFYILKLFRNEKFQIMN